MLLGNSILRIPVHCTYAKWPYVFHNNSNIRKLTSLVIFLALSLCFHNTVFHSTPSVWVELGGGGGGGGGGGQCVDWGRGCFNAQPSMSGTRPASPPEGHCAVQGKALPTTPQCPGGELMSSITSTCVPTCPPLQSVGPVSGAG